MLKNRQINISSKYQNNNSFFIGIILPITSVRLHFFLNLNFKLNNGSK